MEHSKTDYTLLFSLVTVGVVWGTTFFGIRLAVETIPPWFVVAMRQGIAAAIVLVVLLFKKQFAWISWTHFKQQLIPAVLMIVIANGFTTVAEQTLSSGLASIMSALSPLVIFLGSLLFGLQKPSFKGFFGVLLGFFGVVFIFREGLGAILDPNYKEGLFFISIGILGWALGVIYSKKHAHKTGTIGLNLFYQFLISALIQLVLAFLFSENLNPDSWSTKSMLAVLYLAVFGSVLAFFAYYYALKSLSVVQVSLLSYINTIIAVFLGWLILNETVTSDFIVATGLILSGVFITNYKRK